MTEQQIRYELATEFPDVKIVSKSGWFWGLLALVLKPIAPDFRTSYVTTIGKRIAVPTAWDSWQESTRVVILKHERVHLRQAQKMGGFLFSLLYLLAPLPLGLAWFRYRFEREAYLVNIKEGAPIDWVVEQLAGPAYGWAWPFRKSVRKWLEDHS